MSVQTLHQDIDVDGKRLEILQLQMPEARGTILLIHEALGSVAYWKNFPLMLAEATERSIVAYSRAGHGTSEGPVEARSIDYYRKQVDVVLPAILKQLSITEPVLYGHSEGAGIALLYAAMNRNVHAVITECPIVVPEESTAATIRQLQEGYASSDLGERLARYHDRPDEVFQAWIQSNRASFSKDFPLESYLKSIACPVLVLQGSKDEFGGILQYEVIRRNMPSAEHSTYEAGHLLHREVPEQIADRVRTFLEQRQKNN